MNLYCCTNGRYNIYPKKFNMHTKLKVNLKLEKKIRRNIKNWEQMVGYDKWPCMSNSSKII